MDTLEFMLEEPSMAEVLRQVLPGILPAQWRLNENCFIRVHEGKQDLQRSLPIKIRAARHKHAHTTFVVVQDQDSNDCRELKKKLLDICESAQEGAENISVLVRIVCHELEAWYLGDMPALQSAFPSFPVQSLGRKTHLRNPDSYVNPKNELKKRVGDYPQIATARLIASHMSVEENRSHSFRSFVSGVRRIASESHIQAASTCE